MKKISSLMLALVMVVTLFSSCASSSDETTTTTTEIVTETTTQIVENTTDFKLSYTQSDSLNPYKSEALNNQVLQNLVFESLFTLDENYEVQPLIATSYSYTDSTTLVVNIVSGIEFSDGSKITANSVVYAFNQAKESSHWKSSLNAISSASATSDTQITFKLSYANPNAVNLLTFAIASSSNDSDGYPIGSGRYKFSESNGSVWLIVNDNYRNTFNPRFTKIELVNILSSESIDNALNIGNISFAFRDLADDSDIRVTTSEKSVNINNLVYIGINSSRTLTSNEYIRKAISLAIDRETLVKSAYQGYAKAATSVFNSSSSLGKDTTIFSENSDTAAAKQAIQQSGFDSSDLSIEILTSKNSNRVTAAKLIKQQLESVGFKVTIKKVSSSQYKTLVKEKSFDIYIGETKIPNDMCLNAFFTSSGATRYGIDLSSSETATEYKNYLKGESEIGSFMLAFSEELPFIPIVYRMGVICYSKALQGDMQGYQDNNFYKIQDWYY